MHACSIRAYFIYFISITIIKACLFQLFISRIDKLIYTFNRTDKVNSTRFDNCCHKSFTTYNYHHPLPLLQTPPCCPSPATSFISLQGKRAPDTPGGCTLLFPTLLCGADRWFQCADLDWWPRPLSVPWTLLSPFPCFHSPLSPAHLPIIQSFSPSLPLWTTKRYFIFDRNNLIQFESLE